MNKFKIFSRFILAIATSIASLSILTSIIYFYADYETNVVLNTNIDDYTIVFLFIMFGLFLFVSILLFVNFIKNIKVQNKYKNTI